MNGEMIAILAVGVTPGPPRHPTNVLPQHIPRRLSRVRSDPPCPSRRLAAARQFCSAQSTIIG